MPDPSVPIAETVNVVNRAAEFGPEMFMAVLVMVFCAGCLFLVMRVVAGNITAMNAIAAGQAALCHAVSEHNNRTALAADEIHQIAPVINRIDAGVQDTKQKMDMMLYKVGDRNRI